VYLGGLVGMNMGLIGVLSQNASLLVIHNLIGITSIVACIYLMVKTRKPGTELLRDLAMVLTLGYVVALIGHITNFFTYFEHKKGAFTPLKLADHDPQRCALEKRIAVRALNGARPRLPVQLHFYEYQGKPRNSVRLIEYQPLVHPFNAALRFRSS